MHFQLWIPEQDGEHTLPGQSADLLRRVGLEDCAHNFVPILGEPGPGGRDGGRGYAWLHAGRPRPWSALEAVPAVAWDGLEAGRYVVGFGPEDPTPADLLKPHPWDGEPLELGDGRRWVIPTPARLDRTLLVQDDGSLRFEPIRSMNRYTFDAVYEQQARRWEERLRDGLRAAEFDELYQFAVRGLRLNYRITVEVINRLGLITESNAGRIMLAGVGAFYARERAREDASP